MSSDERSETKLLPALALPPLALLAGGLATRLRPLTENIPKALVDVAGQPFVAHQLSLLHEHGIRRVVICVGYLGKMIEEVVGDGSAFGISVQYAADWPRLLGTAGAIKQALPLLGDEFFVMYGDSYLNCDYRAIHHAFKASAQPGLMTVYRNDNQLDASNVIYDGGQIKRYDKIERSPDMHYIDYGLGLLRKGVFDTVPDGEPADLADVYRALAARGALAGYEVRERFYEIGSPQGLDETRRYLGGRG